MDWGLLVIREEFGEEADWEEGERSWHSLLKVDLNLSKSSKPSQTLPPNAKGKFLKIPENCTVIGRQSLLYSVGIVICDRKGPFNLSYGRRYHEVFYSTSDCCYLGLHLPVLSQRTTDS